MSSLRTKIYSDEYMQVYATGTTIIVKTQAGSFQIGVDSDFETYVSTMVGRLMIKPSASNRVLLEEIK